LPPAWEDEDFRRPVRIRVPKLYDIWVIQSAQNINLRLTRLGIHSFNGNLLKRVEQAIPFCDFAKSKSLKAKRTVDFKAATKQEDPLIIIGERVQFGALVSKKASFE
jgi:hypothetical protein